MRRAAIAIAIAVAVTLPACADSDGPSSAAPSTVGTAPETTGAQTSTTLATTTTTTEAPRPACDTPLLGIRRNDPPRILSLDHDPAQFSIAVSEATFGCSDVVVVTAADDPEAVIAAADVASRFGAPLLFGSVQPTAELLGEIERLHPLEVIRVGFGVGLPRLAGIEGSTISVSRVAPGAVSALAQGDGDGPPVITTGTVIGDGANGVVWLTLESDPAATAAAAAASLASGALTAVVDRDDLRADTRIVQAIRSAAAPPGLVVFADGSDVEHADWQLPILVEADELPGGGLLLFPGRRMVALYGNPLTPVLGVLGEQSPAESVARLAQIAEPYGADGLEVLPAFELIATVADSRAGSDGDYSNEMDLDVLRPWIETAADSGLYVLLDLQPGRTDFVTQARRYEEFLRMPHVGLALDPEWRLGPDQFHLVQFGSVDPAEVNQVVDYLAGLVREERLPQKMLLLHQFRLSMIPDRELIETTPELAFVIQMDGQGALADKYATWDAITAGLRDDPDWWWGWKNFYDEDSPTPTPDIVLDLDPVAVYVSYQ